MERINCPQQVTGSCDVCPGMKVFMEAVERGATVDFAESTLKAYVCPEKGQPRMPNFGVRRQSSARWRLVGR